jgi:hypothetical protein
MSNLKSSNLSAGTECPVDGICLPENPDECEFPACLTVGGLRTLNRLGQGQQRLTLNLCDEHYEKVRKGDMGREFINWLVAIVWPRPGFDRLSHAA